MSDTSDAEYDYDETLDTEPDDEIEIDDAGEGDEGEGEVDNDGAEEGEGESQTEGENVVHGQVRRPSRASARVEQALREAKEAKAELARLRSESTTARTAEQNRISAAQEQERLSQMSEAERLEYLLNKQGQQHQTALQQLRFEMQDSADKTAYESLASRVPAAAKLKNEVEQRLAELRAGGTTAPRETVLKYLIGERAIANTGRAKGKAQKTADANRQRQTARPGAARGDVADTGRGATTDKAARAKRLENMQI